MNGTDEGMSLLMYLNMNTPEEQRKHRTLDVLASSGGRVDVDMYEYYVPRADQVGLEAEMLDVGGDPTLSYMGVMVSRLTETGYSYQAMLVEVVKYQADPQRWLNTLLMAMRKEGCL